MRAVGGASASVDRVLLIGELGLRFEVDFIARGMPHAMAPTAATAVIMMKTSRFDVVVVPASVPDMPGSRLALAVLKQYPDVVVLGLAIAVDDFELQGYADEGRFVPLPDATASSAIVDAVRARSRRTSGAPADVTMAGVGRPRPPLPGPPLPVQRGVQIAPSAPTARIVAEGAPQANVEELELPPLPEDAVDAFAMPAQPTFVLNIADIVSQSQEGAAVAPSVADANRIAILQRELDSVRAERDQLKVDAQTQGAMYDAVKMAGAESRADLERVRVELDRARMELDRLRLELERTRAEREEMRRTGGAAEDSRARAAQELQQLRARFTSEMDAANAEIAEHANGETALRQELTLEKTARAKLEQVAAAQASQLKAAQDELAAERARNKEIAARAAQQERSLVEAQGKLELETRNAADGRKLSEHAERKLEQLKQQLARESEESARKLEELRVTLEEARQLRDDAELELATAELQLNDARAAAAAAQERASTAESERDEARREREQAASLIASAVADRAEASGSAEEAERQRAGALSEAQQAVEAAATARDAAERAQSAQREAEDDAAAAREERDAARSERDEARRARDEAQQRADDAQRERDDAQRAIDGARRERDRALRAAEEAQKERAHHGALGAELDTLRRERDEAVQAALDARPARAAFEELKLKLTELKSAVETARRERDEALVSAAEAQSAAARGGAAPERSDLQRALSESRRERDEARAMLADVTQERDGVIAQLAAAKQAREEALQLLDERDAALRKLRSTGVDVTAQGDTTIEGDSHASPTGEALQARTERDIALRAKADAEAARDDALHERDTAVQRWQRAKERTAALEAELAAAKQKPKTGNASVDALEERLESVTADRDRALAALTEASRKLMSLEDELEEARSGK